MNKNVGNIDRIIRIAAGVVLIIWSLMAGLGSVLPMIGLVAGIVLLATGLMGWCLIYNLVGIKTFPPDKG